ncbi:amidohydrolase family protein [Caulobacter segnis]
MLDIYAQVEKTNGVKDRRFRIEHAQHLSQTAIPRFALQKVIASVQPYHAIDDGRWAIKRIGAERAEGHLRLQVADGRRGDRDLRL